MKRIACLLLPLLLAACSNKPRILELTEWQFSWHNQWYPATVPGFVHTDLLSNGLIPDPFYGTNEDSVQWVCDERQWVYRTTVSCADLPHGDSLWLVLDGLAGPCEVSINGGGGYRHFCDDMFCRNVFPFEPVGDSVCITVCFLPLDHNDNHEGIMQKAERYGIDLPERMAFTRMAPYQPGWDWGPRLKTCGIWQPVYVTNHRPAIQTCSDIAMSRPAVEFRQEPDSIGRSFTFYKDGKPLFIKGANWIPVHSFPVDDSANRARYRYLLTSAQEAGFNMVRVWGGGIYEHDFFYDLCDSLGLMVWQDFMFAGTPYPDDPAMLDNIRNEARYQVSRLARHPCIVLWCGNNEVKNGWEDWGWQGLFDWTSEQRARLESAMDTIFGYPGTADNASSTSILAQAVKDCDPMQRPYITTSPLYGWGHPECVTHGDSHYWGVWWGELPFEVYKEKTGRFMSEYGFQSYPMISSIRQFCPEEQLYVGSPTMSGHQKHPYGVQIIDKAMRQYYGFDSKSLSLEDYAYVSQLLQAWGVGYGILCHMNDPRCAGTLFWQLNDCWPVASWSSIDYYGNWKALHYRAQALFNIPPTGLDCADDSEDMAYWQKYYSVYPKDREYPDPKYTVRLKNGDAIVVTINAQSDLYDVYLETEPHVDGHFTRNFFDLRVGESVTASFVPTCPDADLQGVKVRIRTLAELYLKR